MAAITAPAAAPLSEHRSKLGWAVSDALTIAWRNLKAMSRTPEIDRVQHDPADHLRADVPLRVRRRRSTCPATCPTSTS